MSVHMHHREGGKPGFEANSTCHLQTAMCVHGRLTVIDSVKDTQV